MTKSTGAEHVTVHQFFNEVLFGDDDHIELRALPSREHRFFHPDDVKGIDAFIVSHRDQNLYFGVAKRRNVGDGTLENCSTIDAIWADIDFKDRSEDEARSALNVCPLRPSVINRSGGGLHCYWVLNESVDVQQDEPRIRSVLRRLAHSVGADLYSAEPARVLRIPGTLNFKYDPPRLVTIERFDLERIFTLTEIDGVLPSESEDESGGRPFVMPSRVREGTRNDTLFRAARSMVAKGFGEDAIRVAVGAENRAKCEPPLSDEEVRTIVAHAITQADRPGFQSFPLEESREGTNFAPRTAAQIMAGTLPEIDWLWAPYLPAGTLATLVAYMKVGKSTFAYSLAMAIAKGTPFLDFPTKQGGVLILAVEEHPRDWHLRLREFGMCPGDPIHVHGGKLTGLHGTMAALRAYVVEHDIKLVILDTLSRFWADVIDEESNNIQVGRTVDPFLELARDTGVVVLLVHHERKAGGEDGRGIRGGSALFGLVDQALLLERKPGADRSLRILKALGRYSETPHELVIEYSNGTFANRGTPESADSLERDRRIFSALSGEPQRLETLAEATGLSAKQLRKVLDAPHDDVIREGRGKKSDPYTYRLAAADARLSSPTPKGEGKQAKRQKGSTRKRKRGQE